MKTKRNVGIFMVITLISGWLGVIIDSVLTEQPEGNSLGMGLWLILPLITGMILRCIDHDWKDFGVRLHMKASWPWYIVSLIIYPVITLLTVLLAALFGAVDFNGVQITKIIPLMAGAIVGGFIKNIFEEFAWRGYLTPKLIGLKLNDWLIYLISGTIWGLWHSAYYLVFLPDQYFEQTSRYGMVVSATIIMICWSIVFVEIYRLSQSVWPCVIMHAVEDAFPTLLTTGGFIVYTKMGDLWLNPVSGIVTTLALLILGIVLRNIRMEKIRQEI